MSWISLKMTLVTMAPRWFFLGSSRIPPWRGWFLRGTSKSAPRWGGGPLWWRSFQRLICSKKLFWNLHFWIGFHCSYQLWKVSSGIPLPGEQCAKGRHHGYFGFNWIKWEVAQTGCFRQPIWWQRSLCPIQRFPFLSCSFFLFFLVRTREEHYFSFLQHCKSTRPWRPWFGTTTNRRWPDIPHSPSHSAAIAPWRICPSPWLISPFHWRVQISSFFFSFLFLSRQSSYLNPNILVCSTRTSYSETHSRNFKDPGLKPESWSRGCLKAWEKAGPGLEFRPARGYPHLFLVAHNMLARRLTFSSLKHRNWPPCSSNQETPVSNFKRGQVVSNWKRECWRNLCLLGGCWKKQVGFLAASFPPCLSSSSGMRS